MRGWFIGVLFVLAAALVTAQQSTSGDGQDSAVPPLPILKKRQDPTQFSLQNLQDGVSQIIHLARQGQNYIIGFKQDAVADEILSHLDWLDNHLGTQLGLGQIIHRYNITAGQSFYGYSGTFHPTVVQILQQLPIIEVVEPDRMASIEQYSTMVQKTSPWGLTRIWQRTMTRSGYQFNWRAGSGVDVYVLDTGIYTQHTEFGGRAKMGTSFVAEQTGDQNGHGTHVAGTVGGITYGVAKSVNIISVKALNADGSGPWSGIIAALNWIVNTAKQTKRPSVVNISISGPVSGPLNAAVNAAVSAGVHVVVAAGNKGDDSCSYSPSSASNAIVVGAVGNSDTRSSFSNYGNCVTIFGPGERIQSAGTSSPTASLLMSGTSMASPHVSGTLAVYLSQQPKLTPAQMKKLLLKEATLNVVHNARSANNMLFVDPNSLTSAILRGL
ncbi:hypothetical protein RI367_005736 [Sorochytrium milnesiophthora]